MVVCREDVCVGGGVWREGLTATFRLPVDDAKNSTRSAHASLLVALHNESLRLK